MLFLDGVYVACPDGSLRFHSVKAPTTAEITRLASTIAHRVGRFLERQGLLERDAENSYLSGEGAEPEPMDQLLSHSITYRIAVGPQQGRKVFTLQTLPACDDSFGDHVGKVAGFSLHAGVAAGAHERKKLELKTPYRDGITHVIFDPLDFIARLAALAWPAASQTTGQSNPLPRDLCSQQQVPFASDSGQTGQEGQVRHIGCR
jgi:hypothetical protein